MIYFNNLSTITYVLGACKKHLIETCLLRAQNFCLIERENNNHLLGFDIFYVYLPMTQIFGTLKENL